MEEDSRNNFYEENDYFGYVSDGTPIWKSVVVVKEEINDLPMMN